MRRGAALGLVLILLGIAPYASAQPTPNVHAERDSSEADALTSEGLALRRQRRDAEALANFRRAYAIQPIPRTMAQIALAEQALGRWVDAEAHLRTALQAADDPWIARHRQVLAAGLADIQTHLGELEIEADVAGAELWVNGVYAASLPLTQPLRVEAGSVVIEVRAPAYASARRHTSVEAGETAHETIHLVPLVAPPAAVIVVEKPQIHAEQARDKPIAPQSGHYVPQDRPMRAASFVLLGAGAAGLAAGTYFGVRTLETVKDSRCVQYSCPDPRGLALDLEARSLATRSTAWFAFGIVAAGAGAGLFWLSRGRVAPDKPARIRVDLDAGPRGARALLEGAW
jgi:hypothetical protein